MNAQAHRVVVETFKGSTVHAFTTDGELFRSTFNLMYVSQLAIGVDRRLLHARATRYYKGKPDNVEKMRRLLRRIPPKDRVRE